VAAGLAEVKREKNLSLSKTQELKEREVSPLMLYINSAGAK